MKYYAVKNGREPGIYTDWLSTQNQVSSYKGAVFKSFKTRKEAEEFMEEPAKIQKPHTTHMTNQEPQLIAYTDGSCVKKVGGYGFLVLEDKNMKEGSGSVPYTPCTNQIAELYALYMVLRYLDEKNMNPDSILVRSDSMYVINCFTLYIGKWRKNGFITTSNEPVKNQDLIRDINVVLSTFPKLTFEHVYAHQGEVYNERVDKLANLGRSCI